MGQTRRAENAIGCLALAGPTASGKSALAMAIARATALEIVSVDSALVYRGMDIGTAKPDAAARTVVAHHLIDIRDPRDAYSAAEFVRDATRVVAEINARGKLALLVGGTMMYFHALLRGLDAMPAADAGVRAELAMEAAQMGWPALHARLAALDPASAARIAPHDSQRIQRALEVHRLSGQTMSSLHTAAAGRPSAFTGMPMLSLEPVQRSWLHQCIAQRMDAMLQAGFIQEVQALRARADLHPELPAMRCVGYRQAMEALDGRWPMAELRDRAIYATRQLAKRQITWLRSMPQRVVLACDAPGLEDRAMPLVHAMLQGRS